ncbi:ornithine carbamoyltransferase [Candidatus Saccharibacteria bacterium]|nr:ornithine carbamoyltransferase [Candidatus Saccharibacteria bacterium]
MKHFLDLADFSASEIRQILDEALRIKTELKSGKAHTDLLAGKNLAMVFQKPSLRTRVSFEIGMEQLGGHAVYISPNEIGLGERESVADVARVLSGYTDIIMARVFDHEHILQLAEHASVPVINGLSDYNHPCQAMADGLTIIEEFGDILGKHIVFIGDGNNVAQSLMTLAAKLGAKFTLVCPAGFELPEADVAKAREFAKNTDDIVITNSVDAVIKSADVIYTDTWTSMGQEDEAVARRAKFAGFQVNSELLEKAPDHTVVMHCLPAHRGEEIADEVADGNQSRLFAQAENRLHAQKAVLANLKRSIR